jgi:type II secretory pathway component PulF
MISIGEESNDIQNTIMNVREFYDTEVADGVENITAALKPTMMILMASGRLTIKNF